MERAYNREAISAQWGEVCAKMRLEMGDAAFQSWLKPISVHNIDNGSVRLGVPTRFMRDWIIAHYHDRLVRLWGDEVVAMDNFGADLTFYVTRW